jgi:hypothetical protein
VCSTMPSRKLMFLMIMTHVFLPTVVWSAMRLLLKIRTCQVLVAHACNPNYSGGRDQEDHSLKPAHANSSWDPVLKKLVTIKDWRSGSRCRRQERNLCSRIGSIASPQPQQTPWQCDCHRGLCGSPPNSRGCCRGWSASVNTQGPWYTAQKCFVASSKTPERAVCPCA